MIEGLLIDWASFLPQQDTQSETQQDTPQQGSTGGTDFFGKVVNSIVTQESGDNYSAIGIDTGGGNRALGRYQIMASNVPSWSQKFLGMSIKPDEFLNNREYQDKIATGQLKEYYDTALNNGLSDEEAAKYTAVSWYAGQGTAEKYRKTGQISNTNEAGGMPSILKYAMSVVNRAKNS